MARDKKIRLSDEEHNRLSEYRQQRYGTDEVPFGVVVDDLIDVAEGDGE